MKGLCLGVIFSFYFGACSPQTVSQKTDQATTTPQPPPMVGSIITDPQPQQTPQYPQQPPLIAANTTGTQIQTQVQTQTQLSSNTCSGIQAQEDKLNAYVPTQSDLSCTQDSDCVFLSLWWNSQGTLMNQTTSNNINSQYQQLESSFTAMKCPITNIVMGDMVMPPKKVAVCENKICKSQSTSSCGWGFGTVTSSNLTDLGYCFQYLGLSTSDSQIASTSCAKIKDYGFSNYESCSSHLNIVGLCKYPAVTGAPAAQVYYYSPKYTARTSQTACTKGLAPYTNGVWSAH